MCYRSVERSVRKRHTNVEGGSDKNEKRLYNFSACITQKKNNIERL